ncbi:MAG: hypothetical protein KGI97_02820 [Alphaproteobacteria bacterium]|nr:hypothetical protein [Alphaproteobacteria bacterium]
MKLERIVYYFIDHWRGDESVSRAFWLGAIVQWLLTLPLSFFALWVTLALNHTTISGYIETSVNASIQGTAPPLVPTPFWADGLNQLASLASIVWWCVGAWRSCENPLYSDNGKKRYVWTKAGVILSAAFGFYSFASWIVSVV